MSTFNYSKLATLVPKQLQEKKEPEPPVESNPASPAPQTRLAPPPGPTHTARPKAVTAKSKVLTSTPLISRSQQVEPVDVNAGFVDVNTPFVDVNSGPVDVNMTSTGSTPRRQQVEPVDVNRFKHRKPVHVTRHTIWLPHKLSANLTTFCKENGIALSEFVTEAVSRLLPAVDVNTFNPLTSTPSNPLTSTKRHHDHDHDDNHDHDDIIIMQHFRTYTGKNPTPKDRRMAQTYTAIDPRLIEIAMVLTVERKLRGNTSKQPIQSFNYFIPEIETILSQEKNHELPGTLEEYHKYVLNTWTKRIKPVRDEKWAIPKEPEA